MSLPTSILLPSPPTLTLEFVKRSDERYKFIRDRHYVPNKGAHAQQLHFLVQHQDNIAGIISAGSAAWAVAGRDQFFGINKDNRRQLLNGLIDNTVFRLESRIPNLASQSLAMWRKVSAKLWTNLYGAEVYGFETFIVQEPAGKLDQNGEPIPVDRNGHLYKADNWAYVGETAGNSKHHSGLNSEASRENTMQKMLYCRWAQGHDKAVAADYKSSWKATTVEEKARAKALTATRKLYLGAKFFVLQGRVFYTLLMAILKGATTLSPSVWRNRARYLTFAYATSIFCNSLRTNSTLRLTKKRRNPTAERVHAVELDACCHTRRVNFPLHNFFEDESQTMPRRVPTLPPRVRKQGN
jgi:Domain of unknown function (DUF4338)